MKGLDWTNETWVRLYRSDSPAWKRLKWEAQSVYLGLQRKLDRAGCLSLDGLMDFEAVAEMTGCPEDVAERALPRLYQLGFLVKAEDGDMIVDPEYIERDEAASSDAQRKRDSRARRRDRTMSRSVTGESQNVTEPSQPVTRGHSASLRDETRRDEQRREDSCAEPLEDERPAPPAAGWIPYTGKSPERRARRQVPEQVESGEPEPWSEMAILDSDLAPLRTAYPGVDVDAELCKARSWCLANGTRRKTVRGIPKFLNGWMERAQNGTRAGKPVERNARTVADAIDDLETTWRT